jgi:outer membrane protein OmpA-like peptidoglycan-associated protein
MLDRIVAVAILCPEVIIQVEGHTDSTGPMAYNQRLSERRAESGATVLNTRGIWKEQLATIGYGETRPIASNRTAAGRAKNRRIEFKVQETQP